MFFILTVLSGLLLVFTLLPLLRYEVWWIRIFDFPRLQLAILALFLLAASVVYLDLSQLKSWILVIISGGCFFYHCWWILPLTKIYPPEVAQTTNPDSDERIRLVTANVLMTNRNMDSFLEIIRTANPDLFVTLESDKKWEEKLDLLEYEYPHTVKCPLDNLYGMHLYSKLPLENSSVKYLVEPGVPSIHTKVILPSGREVKMHFLHPVPPSPTTGNEESTERDVELLIVGEKVTETNSPVIVTGDLNDVAWSETTRLFKKISQLLDPRIGRGFYNTFNANYWFLRWPVDYVFHSSHFTLTGIERLPYFGSDHFPIMVEVVYDNKATSMNQKKAVDVDDQKEADKKTGKRPAQKEDVPDPAS